MLIKPEVRIGVLTPVSERYILLMVFRGLEYFDGVWLIKGPNFYISLKQSPYYPEIRCFILFSDVNMDPRRLQSEGKICLLYENESLRWFNSQGELYARRIQDKVKNLVKIAQLIALRLRESGVLIRLPQLLH